MRKLSPSVLNLVFAFSVWITSAYSVEYLVKMTQDDSVIEAFRDHYGGTLDRLSIPGRLYKWTTSRESISNEAQFPGVEYIVPNRVITLFENPSIVKNKGLIAQALEAVVLSSREEPAYPDNPAIQPPVTHVAGLDPMVGGAWGIQLIGAPVGWVKSKKGDGIIVAVTDTGVDYNHVDLINNMWRNPKEIPNDGKDNDNNGYIDDIVGWDFNSQDNLPYDLSMSLIDILLGQGNPGHGTHVAGVIAATLGNSIGVGGVSPQAKIMALRFINEKGQGSLGGAVTSVDYAVANGALVISASWGSEGTEPGDAPLREAIQRAKAKGVIFVAAAGNGRLDPATFKSAGINNDTDPKPVFPATYPYENIISVAATDSNDSLAPFSNFGPGSVDIGAPGVKILSTVPGNRFQDTLFELGSLKITWDGTSMATPMVSGAIAAVWSQDPKQPWAKVREKVLAGAAPSNYLKGKVATEGRLDVRGIVQQE